MTNHEEAGTHKQLTAEAISMEKEATSLLQWRPTKRHHSTYFKSRGGTRRAGVFQSNKNTRCDNCPV